MSKGFKSIGSMSLADERWSHIVIRSRNSPSERPISLNDFYSRLNGIKFNNDIPENILEHFDTAKNLALYSWHVYEFAVIARQQAYICVELALKTKVGELSEYRAKVGKLTLKNLLDIAQKMNWVDPKQFTTQQLESLLSLRNSLLHGSSFLHEDWSSPLYFAASFIDMLYRSGKM